MRTLKAGVTAAVSLYPIHFPCVIRWCTLYEQKYGTVINNCYGYQRVCLNINFPIAQSICGFMNLKVTGVVLNCYCTGFFWIKDCDGLQNYCLPFNGYIYMYNVLYIFADLCIIIYS